MRKWKPLPPTCPYPESFHALPKAFFKIHFIIILPSAPSYSRWSLSLRLPHQSSIGIIPDAPFQNFSLKSILILSCHLCLVIPDGPFPSSFPTQTLYAPSLYMPHSKRFFWSILILYSLLRLVIPGELFPSISPPKPYMHHYHTCHIPHPSPSCFATLPTKKRRQAKTEINQKRETMGSQFLVFVAKNSWLFCLANPCWRSFCVCVCVCACVRACVEGCSLLSFSRSRQLKANRTMHCLMSPPATHDSIASQGVPCNW